jgi:hypothetical protein
MEGGGGVGKRGTNRWACTSGAVGRYGGGGGGRDGVGVISCRACKSFGGKGSMQQQEKIKVFTLGLLEFGCHLPYKIQSCSAAQF